jgi:hypothetical protein
MGSSLNFSVLNDLIKNDGKMREDIRLNRNLDKYILECHLFILLFSFLYGVVTGLFVGGLQILLNAVKIPVVIFGIIYISLPIFIVFNAFLDNNINVKQIIATFMAGFAIFTIILATFAPLILLFSTTTADVEFIILMHTSVGALGLFIGFIMIFQLNRVLHTNRRDIAAILLSYFIIFFSGSQLIWAMRPYLHYSPTIVEPIKSNFYIEIFKVMAADPGLSALFILIFGLVALIIVYNLYFKQEIDPLFFIGEELPPDKDKNNVDVEEMPKRKRRQSRKAPLNQSYPYQYYYPYPYYYQQYNKHPDVRKN